MYSLTEQHRTIQIRELFEEATTIICLACEDGYEIAEAVFKDKR